MKHLFFDTETAGLPRVWRSPASPGDNWPRVVQIAWAMAESEDEAGSAETRIIRPDGFEIPADASRVHGITSEFATEHGVDLGDVLDEFAAAVAESDVVVAHNINFDVNVMGSEFLRAVRGNPFAGKPLVCTMEASTDYCAIPGKEGYGFKWPSLSQLHEHLFETGFDGAHDASADMLACMKCYFELRSRGVMSA